MRLGLKIAAETGRAPGLVGPLTGFVVLSVAMGLCFRDFPTHLRAVAAALILVHASASMAVAVVRLELRRLHEFIWRSQLTLRLGIDELARRIASGEAAQPGFDTDPLWLAASEEARTDVERYLDDHIEDAPFDASLLGRAVTHVAGLAIFYGAAGLTALGLARII